MTARLLAQPASHDVESLCELRNQLLLASYHHNSFLFLTNDNFAKLLNTTNGSGMQSFNSYNSGFYRDFGRPISVLVSTKVVTFWPDEWKDYIGGSKAVGLPIQYFDVNSNIWVDGQVTDYNSDDNTYSVKTTLQAVNTDNSENRLDQQMPENPVVLLDLETVPHAWVDANSRQGTSSPCSTKLKYTHVDIGRFVRIWWSRYNRHYYGRVTAFDSNSKAHTVTYEDKDARAYDMTTKEYEIIEPPADVLRQAIALDDAAASQTVAIWHRTNKTVSISYNTESQLSTVGGGETDKARGDATSSDLVISRPSAATAFNISSHQITLLNEYFCCGGFQNMLQSLADSSQVPPSMKIMLFHLQFVYQLKAFVGAKRFRGLVWDLKECIPSAFARFDERQLKDFTIREFNDVQNTLKDLVVIAGNETNESYNNDMQENLEFLRLSLSLKLLGTNKVQKRYIGMSIVKEMVEAVNPKIAPYLLKRYVALGINKSSMSAGQSRLGPQKSPLRIVLTVNQIDRWLGTSNVLDMFLGDNFQPEMVAKADSLFVYLAHKKILSDRHVQLLWQATKGAHETVVRTVYQLFLIVIPSMEMSLRLFLFNLMSTLSKREYSEQFLRFTSAFTVQILKVIHEEEQRKDGPTSANAAPQKAGTTSSEAAKRDEKRGSNNVSSRKGQIVNTPQKQYFGFTLLWQCIQDPSEENEYGSIFILDKDLQEVALDLLIGLLRDEFQEDRDAVMQNCIESIESGISVPASLNLLRRTLNLYPQTPKSWFVLSRQQPFKGVTIAQQIEKLIKQSRLLDIIFGELERLHVHTTHSATSHNNSPRAAYETTTTRGGSIATTGVVERLDFLQFVLSKSLVRLSEAQIFILWRVFGEGSSSEEALDKLCIWLDGLIMKENPGVKQILKLLSQEVESYDSDNTTNLRDLSTLWKDLPIVGDGADGLEFDQASSILEDTVMITFFENCILPWAFSEARVSSLLRPSVASLAFKLFVFINLQKKVLRLDNDGGWYRVGSLVGLPLLWRIAVDSEDLALSYCAAKLLVETHHRSLAKSRVNDTSTEKFLRLCFKQLYQCVQSLHVDEVVVEGGEFGTFIDTDLPPVSVAGSSRSLRPNEQAVDYSKYEDWFEAGGTLQTKQSLARRIFRLLSVLRSFMLRFYYFPSYIVNVRIISRNDQAPLCSFKFLSSDNLGMVRQKVGGFFREEPSNLSFKKIDRDDSTTLAQLKFALEEDLVVRRVEAPPPSNNSNNNVKGNSSHQILTTVVEAVPDLIKLDDLSDNFSKVYKPLSWLDITSRNAAGNVLDVFSAPPFPVSSLKNKFSRDTSIGETLDPALDFLIPVIRSCPYYIDQLLEMLDGIFPASSEFHADNEELSTCTWDILQSLPFHLTITQQILSIVTVEDDSQLKRTFDLNNPYRLLYGLQVLDCYLDSHNGQEYRLGVVANASLKVIADLPIKFFRLGGVEHLLALLTAVVEGLQDCSERSKVDLYVTICSMLLRLLHRMLQLDSLYLEWQVSNNTSSTTSNRLAEESELAPGLVLSFIDIANVFNLFKSVCILVNQTLRSSLIAANTVQGLIENGIELMFGLAIAHEDGAIHLQTNGLFQLILQYVISYCDDKQGRIAITRRLFENTCRIFLKCADPLLAQERKGSRVLLFDFMCHTVLSAIFPELLTPSSQSPLPASSPTTKASTGGFDVLLNLAAGLESLRISPESLFSELVVSKASAHPGGDGSEVTTPATSFGTSSASARSSIGITYFEPSQLIDCVIHRLTNYQSTESFHSAQPDDYLIGLLRLLLVFSSGEYELRKSIGETVVNDSNFISFLFNVLLFPPTNQQNTCNNSSPVAVCQSPESRTVVYALLYKLCQSTVENFSKLAATIAMSQTTNSPRGVEGSVKAKKVSSETTGEMIITPFNRRRTKTKRRGQWDYNPNALLKASDEFVGLCNQGGTCYMNSFIQQLFHIRSFTDGLLQIAQYVDDPDLDAVLFQLQVMFGYLKLSQKKYYDTLPFCRTLLEYDGQPISLSEQKDINEFAGMLFDKLEKNAACSQLLDRTIRGKFVWKTRSLETPYRSEKEESFDMITVDVKEKKNVEESLELSIAEELFSGENKIEDSVAGRKVDAVRSCAIRTLPPTLVIQLKRFEFDLETLNRKKVNDYFSFPMELNMFPYTEEGVLAANNTDDEGEAAPVVLDDEIGKEIEAEDGVEDGVEENVFATSEKYLKFSTPIRKADSHYRYVLTGIVAHVGAIDRGHYYSFIKDRETGLWHEFNDRTVLPFSPEQIPKECFGGYDEIVNPNNSTTMLKYRENNAYLLVYDRKDSIMAEKKLMLSPSVSSVRLLEQATVSGSSASWMVPSSSEAAVVKSQANAVIDANNEFSITDKVLKAVWTENTEFQIDRFLFDQTNCQFFWQLCSCSALTTVCDGQFDKQTLENWTVGLLKFLVEVVIHARAQACIAPFLERLEDLMMQDKQLSSALSLVQCLCSYEEAPIAPGAVESFDAAIEDVSSSAPVCIHPWLVVIFVDCPHGNAIQSFARLITTAFNVTRKLITEDDVQHFLLNREDQPAQQEQSGSQVAAAWLQSLPADAPLSLLARLCNQLLLVIESMQPEDIARKDGYRYACWILHQVAMSNVNESIMLVRLFTIERY